MSILKWIETWLRPEKVMSRLEQAALKDFIVQNRDYEFAVELGDEQEKKNREWAMKVVFYCMAGILVVLALILGSLTQPLIGYFACTVCIGRCTVGFIFS